MYFGFPKSTVLPLFMHLDSCIYAQWPAHWLPQRYSALSWESTVQSGGNMSGCLQVPVSIQPFMGRTRIGREGPRVKWFWEERGLEEMDWLWCGGGRGAQEPHEVKDGIKNQRQRISELGFVCVGSGKRTNLWNKRKWGKNSLPLFLYWAVWKQSSQSELSLHFFNLISSGPVRETL